MPTVLITGASGGIGLELARVFARNGYSLVLVARNRAALETLAAELKPAPVQVIALDLTVPDAPQQVFQAAPKVDVLVNNAGYSVFGKFADMPLTDHLGIMQLNMTALIALCRLYLPSMLASRSGRILNVASTAAFQPGPLMAIYYATKAFVLSFSEAMGNELEGTGVTVTTLCPGPTGSGFQARAKMENSGLVKGRKIMDARTVAEAGYRAVMAGKSVEIPGLLNKIMAQSVRATPRKVIVKIVRAMQEKR